jgi:hypothetical protein
MISANELRIGNLFHPIRTNTGVHLPETGIVMKVIELKAFEISACLNFQHPCEVVKWSEFQYSELSPVPLTPEILDKCGLETVIKEKWKSINGISYWFYFDNEARFVIGIGNAPNSSSHQVIWKFEDMKLHQLQNVYYALTLGEELKVNL